MARTAETTDSEPGLWSPTFRNFTAGLFVTILMAAFETYAITSVAPLIASDLNALDQYTWIFSAAMLPQIVGTVVFARIVDGRGPAHALVWGALLMTVGLILASSAGTMLWMIAGRVLQGLGMGALINVVYASISQVLPDRLRPRAFALISGAYVLPAVVGPFLTGLLTDMFSWRAVFYGVLPFLAVALALVLPTLRRVAPQGASATDRMAAPLAIVLAVAVASTTAGLTRITTLDGVLLSVAGLVGVVYAAGRILPSGVFRAQPVRPAALATRGLTTAVFVGIETLVVYSLTLQHDLSVTKVGLAISLSALTWALASWLQSRWDARDKGAGRGRRMLIGVTVVLAAESLSLSLPWQSSADAALFIAALSHTLSGFGMGLAEPISGTLALSATDEGESGVTASGMQLADLVTPALGIAVGGALINGLGGEDLRWGITAAIAAQLVLAGLAVLSATRLRNVGVPKPGNP